MSYNVDVVENRYRLRGEFHSIEANQPIRNGMKTDSYPTSQSALSHRVPIRWPSAIPEKNSYSPP